MSINVLAFLPMPEGRGFRGGLVSVESNALLNCLERVADVAQSDCQYVMIKLTDGGSISLSMLNSSGGVNDENILALNMFGPASGSLCVRAVFERSLLMDYLSMCPSKYVDLYLYKDAYDDSECFTLKNRMFMRSRGLGDGDDADWREWSAYLYPEVARVSVV